jgi:hypothetical protein
MRYDRDNRGERRPGVQDGQLKVSAEAAFPADALLNSLFGTCSKATL